MSGFFIVMYRHKKMNRIIGSIGKVLLFTIIITTTTTTAAVRIILESGIINVSHAQTFQRLPSTGLEVTTTPGANPV
jgi:hypothetical protein